MMKKFARSLLAIDIGNSNVSYGLFEQNQRRKDGFGSCIYRWDGGINIFPKIVRKIVKSGVNIKTLQIIIDSVNPSKLQFLSKLINKKTGGLKPWIVGKNVSIHIKHKYSSMNRLGKDRLVNLYGLMRFYSNPGLVFDLGTATTVDFVSGRGIFEGGMIIPGIETSYRALEERAALLPKKSRLKRTKAFLGRNTNACMQTGMLQGYGAMVDGLIERFEKRFGRMQTILMTGGLSSLLRSYICARVVVDPDHTLKSLALIYREIIEGSGYFRPTHSERSN